MDEKQMLLMAAKAAKAAGLNVFEMGGTFLYKPYANHSIVHRWNPLDDDGDALRLAVKLNLCVSQWTRTSYPPHVMVGYRTAPDFGANLTEDHGDDPCAATRLAIVRAAAAIGEQSNE